MLRAYKQDDEIKEEGSTYSGVNSTPQFERAKQLVDPVIEKLLLERSPQDLKVLDVGCGTGDLAAYISQTYNVQVDAFDVSKPMIEKASDTHAASGVNFWVGNAENFQTKQKYGH